MRTRVLLLVLTTFLALNLYALPPGGGGGGVCNGPNPPAWCPVIPIDNHLIWLFGLGLIFTGYKIYKISKSKSTI